MQYEAYPQSGVLPYERSPQRKAYRNGTRPRTLKSRVGEITLEKLQFRESPFESKVFERFSRVEQALLMTIAESYIQGVSTLSRMGIAADMHQPVSEHLAKF